ncbi:MAG TPA: NADPH:quinone oxidoreductase family protein [Ilumatobacter sp.]|nr:NADPH:quinone oxidoreductase family protein [Ilumatobacter sp.]
MGIRAAVCHEYGTPDVVVVETVDAPDLEAGQVRIDAAVGAVNYPDVLLVANQYQISAPTPFTPGSELAGVICEVADDVTGIAVGDRVSATMMVGAFAEQVVVPAASVAPIAPNVDFVVAAAVGVAHRTSMHVLRSVARVQPGEYVVVLGAGGGVGLAAVQLATLFGATVIAVASSDEKLQAAADAGAAHLVNYKTQTIRDEYKRIAPRGIDVVVDPVGGPLAEPTLRSMRWGGRYVTVGFASQEVPKIPLNLVLLKGMTIHGFEFRAFTNNAPEEFARNEAELATLVASGKIVPLIGASFPLDRVVDALRLVGDGAAVGKVIIEIAPTTILRPK